MKFNIRRDRYLNLDNRILFSSRQAKNTFTYLLTFQMYEIYGRYRCWSVSQMKSYRFSCRSPKSYIQMWQRRLLIKIKASEEFDRWTCTWHSSMHSSTGEIIKLETIADLVIEKHFISIYDIRLRPRLTFPSIVTVKGVNKQKCLTTGSLTFSVPQLHQTTSDPSFQ